MRVLAAKLSEDISSTRIAYEKKGKLFVRSGEDKFTTGVPVRGSIEGLYRWGFRKVDNEPVFRDGIELLQNINRFELKANGQVTYSG